MKEAKGNMLLVACDAICVTTNGYVNRSGNAVMGRGIAQSVAQQLNHVPRKLGQMITQYGNVCQIIDPQTESNPALLSFPVKPITVQYEYPSRIVIHKRGHFKIGETVPGCFAVADLEIIEQSAVRLAALTDQHGWENVILPRAGCGAGELLWKDVKPLLSKYLDDRFTAYTY